MRFCGLDFARSLFMVFGVFYHCALIFSEKVTWLVTHSQTHPLLDHFSTFIHYFRMYAFYIIAGFFFMYTIEKYGIKKSLEHRLLRLGIPLFFIGFTLNSVTNRLSENVDFSNSFYDYFIKGEWLVHLWFIGNLLVYDWIALVFLALLKKLALVRLPAYLFLVILLPIFVVISTLSAVFGSHLSQTLIFVHLPSLFLYFPFFLLGLVFYGNKESFFLALNLKVSSVFLIFSAAILYTAEHFNLDTISYVAKACEMTFSLSLSVFIMGLTNNFAVESKNLSRLVDSSYTIYLVHTPIILMIFPLVAFLDIDVFPSFFMISFLTLLISFSLHEWLVLNNPYFAFFMNGITRDKYNKNYKLRNATVIANK